MTKNHLKRLCLKLKLKLSFLEDFIMIENSKYQNIIDQYQITFIKNRGSSKIKNCNFLSNLHKIQDINDFNFRIFHETDNFFYEINNYMREDYYYYYYTFNDKCKIYFFEIRSDHIFSFEELNEIFHNNYEHEKIYYYAIPMQFLFGRIVDYNLNLIGYETFSFQSKNEKLYTAKYGDNFVQFFKLTDSNEHKYIIQIKYNNLWFRVIEKDSNIVMTLHNYFGDFLNLNNINVNKIIDVNLFNSESILKLFNEASFNKMMSKIETEIIFS